MKKHFLKSFALIAMLFSALTLSAASGVDWSTYAFLGDGAGGGKYTDKYKVSASEGLSVVNIQVPGFTQEPSIYATVPAGISDCNVSNTIQGAGIALHLSAFTAQETQVIINYAGGSCTFWVYYADGTEGGEGGGETPGEGEEPVEPAPDPEDPEVTDKWADVDWVAVDWVAASDNKYKIYSECLTQVVSVQQPGWANEKGIYVTVPAGISECSVNGAIDGAGMILYLSSFTAKETEVTITHALGSCTFLVYYADGTEDENSGEGGESPEVEEQVKEGFEWDGTAVASPSNKGFGTFQGRLDLYNIVDGYAGTDACGQVDLYVVTWGNNMLYKAKLVNNQFIDNDTGWRCQLRTRNAELSDDVRETWAIAATEDGTTRYTIYGDLNNTKGLNGYGETFKVYSYMTVKKCAPDARTIETLTYTRDYINNPIEDNTAPTLLGAANVTSTAENVTIALPAVTSEEVFYMIKDEAHNKQYISITPSFILPQDGSGVTYTYSCYAVDFNGNMSDPLTVEFLMPFNAANNLALNKPSQAGFEANNMGASKANDGNKDTRWASGGGNNPTDAWWYVDLGESYNLSTIEISWEGAYASDYVIMGSDEYIDPTNATAWQTATTLVVKDVAPTVGNNTQEVYSLTGSHARYIRLQANTLADNGWGCSFWEFRVFGTGVYDPNAAADTEKPTITSATPKTPIAHNEVQITIVASDNVGVASYEVKDDANGVSATCVPVENVITVSNLQEQTTYNLTIVAVDAVGNKSDAYAMAAFTTGINLYVPHESAPVPNHDAKNVISFYSDTYAPVVNLWGKAQWNAVLVKENTIAEDKYLCYTEKTWWGWEFHVNAGANKDGVSSGVDCSNMEYLHIDVWGFEDGTLRVTPIWGGNDLVENKALATNDRYYALVEISANQWNSVDIPLATGFQPETDKHDFSSIFQFKFAELSTSTISIDNVYFYKVDPTTTNVENAVDKLNTQKTLLNGVLYIIRNGVTYDVMGRVVR